ncbi:hypothetical protein, partial [Neobittarella massiliensis]|uniref:hypothetical protein n=1 Tax=Neobittarella massiliensis (ex Bilen et al. 2018) TaxID=2041842 RepID=UPI001A9B8798
FAGAFRPRRQTRLLGRFLGPLSLTACLYYHTPYRLSTPFYYLFYFFYRIPILLYGVYFYSLLSSAIITHWNKKRETHSVRLSLFLNIQNLGFNRHRRPAA